MITSTSSSCSFFSSVRKLEAHFAQFEHGIKTFLSFVYENSEMKLE